MADNVEIRVPKWLVYLVGALFLVAAGVGAGLVVGGDGSEATVAAGKRPKSTTTSTSTSTTSTTAAPVAAPSNGGGGGNNAGNGGGGDAAGDANAGGGAALPPAAPAATADVTKSAGCPTVVTWNGTGGVSYTLRVNSAAGGAPLFPSDGTNYGTVSANGQMSFACAGNPGVPRVGSVQFNTNHATGTVSDSAS